MVTLDILGANRYDTYSKTRTGCRGIVVRDGQILLSHETVTGWYLLPGGGLEPGETPEACCVREIEEETGYVVRPLRQFLTLNEYYEEYRYVSHYFVCGIVRRGEQRLTASEARRGLEPAWVPLAEAVELFSRHADYDGVDEDRRGSYLREYTALTEYLKQS